MMIVTYKEKYQQDIIDLVLSIQQKEFNIPITLEGQPDLKQVPGVYQSGKGNFWIALSNDRVVGSIGLIDIGHRAGAIRKMFVHPSYRGREQGVARQLLETLVQWSAQQHIKDLFLGTVEQLKAAHRFYEKNGFNRIAVDDLPHYFPRMALDTIFYHYRVEE